MDTPASFDPVDSLSLPDYIVSRASFDTLVRKDDSGLVPGLAESWETTPTSLDFVIREGGTCSDGTPITARFIMREIGGQVRAMNVTPIEKDKVA